MYSFYTRIIRWCQIHILSFILSSFYFLTIVNQLTFHLHIRCRHNHPYPPGRVVLRKGNTASSLTVYKVLATVDSLQRPPRLQRRICHCACLCLWRRPPSPPTSDICWELYERIHSYSVICTLNTKAVFSKCITTFAQQ